MCSFLLWGKKICLKQSPLYHFWRPQSLNFHQSPWETCARPQLSHGRMLIVGSNAAWISSFAATVPGACHLGAGIHVWRFPSKGLGKLRRSFGFQIWLESLWSAHKIFHGGALDKLSPDPAILLKIHTLTLQSKSRAWFSSISINVES